MMTQIKHQRPRQGLLGLGNLVVIGCLAAGARVAWAGLGELPVDTEYTVTYQIGNGSSTLPRVRLVDIVSIESRRFLVVYLAGYKTRTYVDWDSVRSLVPSSQ